MFEPCELNFDQKTPRSFYEEPQPVFLDRKGTLSDFDIMETVIKRRDTLDDKVHPTPFII